MLGLLIKLGTKTRRRRPRRRRRSRGKPKRHRAKQKQRRYEDITKLNSLLFRKQKHRDLIPKANYLKYIEDDRTYEQKRRNKKPFMINGQPARIRQREIPVWQKNRMFRTIKSEFIDQKRTIVCIRRKQRRSVLFAKGKTGRGSRQKNRRRTPKSLIVCRKVTIG